jgi:uncharacterized protein YigA (DUF484 family)
VAVLAVMAGCSGGGGVAETTSAGGAADSAVIRSQTGAAGAPDASGGKGAAAVNRPRVQTRALIRTGTVTLVVRDLDRARDEVDGLLSRYGGYLSDADVANGPHGRDARAVLELRVPTRDFDTVMGALEQLGRPRGSHRATEDVTREVIDVDSRVATQRASIERLRRLMGKASNVDDMIRIESEIATRQAELESLEAQQAYLRDQTSMSTITAHLSVARRDTPPPGHDDSGFLPGLRSGWHALTVVVVGVATALGAVLPFAGALALVGLPVWLLVRRVSASSARGRSRSGEPADPGQ